LKNYVASCNLAIIICEQPSQALPTHHLPLLAPDAWLWSNELVVKTLMVSLVVIMRQVRLDHRTQRGLSDHDHLLQRFCFDRAHEPFTVRIEIRTPWRQDDRLYSTGTQHLVEGMSKFLVPVVEQIPCAEQEAIP
jgi:hypothetical protein